MSKISKLIFILPAIMLLLSTLVNAQNNVPAINNLSAEQRAGSNLVDIHFDLSDLDGELLLVRISITNNGIVINTPSLSGDVGFNVSPDTGKHVIWDAGADYFDQFGEYVVVKVEASDALSDAVAYSDPFTVDTRIDKPPVDGWQVVTDSGRSYNENILIDNDGRIWCFYLRSPGSHQPVYMKVIDSDGYVIRSETIIGRASSLVSNEKQTIRALLNPKTEDVWVVIQGSHEGTHTGHYMIFDELMNIKKDSTAIPASDHVIAPKVAADSSGNMWFSWHTDTTSAESRGSYISCSASGEFDPAGASYFTDFSYVINTDIAIDSNDHIWFLYERNEEAGYLIYDTEKALIGTDIYSTEPLEFDARKSILADRRNNTVWTLQKNLNAEFYRLNGFDIQPAANFGGINLVGECTFFINENKRLELVRYNSDEKIYENSVYNAANGEISQSWSTLFSDLPSPGAVYDYAAYNPDVPNLKAYLVRTDDAMTRVKLTDVIPESITLALSRDSIDFGKVGLDTSKTEYIRIYNTGNSTLLVNDMFTTNSHYTVDKTSLSIDPQDSAQVAVTFVPTDLQIVSSSLKIYTNAVDAIQTVPLLGEGYERIWRIAVSPDTLDFDSLGVGYQTTRSFSIKNSGTEPASIRSITVNQIQFSVDDTPFSISAGDSQKVAVTYTPQFVGLSTGRALITSNAESAVDSVILMGVGMETVWSMRTNPDTVDFDLVPIGYTDVDTFVIVNTGTEPFDVDSITVNNEHFSVNDKFGYSISAGDSHYVQVAFSPTHTEPLQARAVIHTDPEITGLQVSQLSSAGQRSNEDNVVTLSGIGFYLNASKIEITPRSLDFDSVQTKSSKTLYVNVRNSGSELLSVTNIVSSDNQFSIENNEISFTLLTGESKEVGIVFTPVYGLVANADVVFYSNDPIDNQLAVQVTGHGFGPPDIYVNPESGLNFSEPVIVGDDAVKSFNISNIGADTLHISSISISDSQFKAVYDSSIHGRTPLIAPPPNDRSVFVSVTFAPEKAGEIDAVLTIESNDPDSMTLQYPLTGIGRLPGPPQITVQPDTLNFGVVDLKAAKQMNFKIANRGESDLVISEIESDNNHFTVGFSQQQTIPGGDSLYFAVQFVPDSSLVYRGNLRIYSNDPEQSTFSMRLRGEGRPLFDQHIVVEPEELDFGELAVDQSTTKYFWVYNTGEKSLVVSDIMSSESEVTVNRTSFTVRPGAYQYVAATFKPKTPGTVFGNIAIINNDPENAIIYVTYSGQGRELNPAYISTSAPQSTISFGSVGLNRSVSKYVKIYNTGEQALTVSNVQTNNQQYTVNSSSFIIYPNSYRWLYVTFKPQAIGAVNAELTIYSDASNARSYIVNLTGTGRALTPPSATLSHSQYNFGEIGITSERSFYLRVNNSGEETLSVQLSHGDTSAFRYNISNFSVHSGGSQYVLIFFKPENVGSYQDIVTLTTNDPERPALYVSLSGAGREMYAQKINVDPEILSFDSVGVGLSRSKSIWIANDGEKDLVIQNIYATNSVFTLENQEITIDPGEHRYVYVTFKPLASIAYDDTLFIENNDPDASVYKLPVTGFGRNLIDPRISITPAFLEYGDVALKDSLIRSIYLTNTGERLLEITGITRTDRNNFWIPAEQQSFSIEPNQSKSIQVEFKPVENKTFDDSLIVRSNDPSNPNAVVRLSATGRDSLTQQLTIQPESLIFTETAVGYSKTQYIQLTNSGEKRLVIQQIDNENTHFVQNFKSLVLGAYESRELGITFTPSKLETYEDTLTVQSNDPEFPVQRIAMRGAGRSLTDPQLVTTPDSLAYGEVYLGASRQQGFTISNGGDLPLRIYGISTTDTQFTADVSDTFTVEGGSSSWIEATFSPMSDGFASAIMTIQSNAGTSEIGLSGVGVRNTFVPTVSVSPSKLNFETVAINIVHAKTLWISNIGYDTLRVSNISSSNPVFTIAASDTSFSLAQNSYRAVNVYFNADSVDSFTGTFYIMSNDPNQPEFAVTVSATSRNLLDPKIYVARDSLNFGTVPLNNKTAMNLMIQNTGEQRLDITDIAVSDSQFSVLSREFSISSKSYYYLPVYFQPDSVGTRTGMMTILNSDPTNESLNVVLRGTGRNLVPQSIALSADSLNFGTTVINRSRSRSFYVINTGEVSLEVTGMTVASDQFTINDDIFVVAPSDSHLVVVTYNPTRTDTINIDLVIRNNDSDDKKQILNIPVMAQCIKYDGPQIALNPTVIQYDDLLLGSRKERSFYVINNAIDSTLVVSDIRVSQYFDENYIITPKSFTVAAGDSEIVYVTFSPQYPGYFNTDLIVFHNDEFSENDRVKLYGRAIQNISGTNVLSSISGWQSSGYYPFSNVLKNGPDNAWFLKDFYLQSMPSSAMLYVSFKDSLRLFINGSFVQSATSDTIKRIQSWNISDLDVSDYLNVGRNRITAYVSNQSGQSGFDCVLLVDGAPVIRHGGFYPDESALWYYYGISGVRSTIPVVYENRSWYSFEYGWTGLSDIVADWNFELGSNDTTYDNSDFGRRIETKNVLSVPGIIGKGIQFTGDNSSYVKMHANLDGIPRTMQLWLYSYESLSRDQVIMNNGSPGYYGNGMYLDDRSTLWIYYPNGKFSTGYTLRPQKWYQLVVKYESDVIHVYVNRQRIISYNYVRGLPQGKSYTYIGGNPDISTASNGFFGIIDELKILNDTESQVVMPDIVSIAVNDTTGASGQPFNLHLHVEPSPFALRSGIVEYAKGGYLEFREATFSVQDSNNVGSDIWVQIPSEDVSINGLKCRIRLETDYGTKTFPDPALDDSLIWIPVYTAGESATVVIDTVFKMFSVPYALDDKSVESVLVDNLGIYSPYDWRLFQWDASPGVKDYVEYSDQSWAEQPGLEQGRAVWIVGAQPNGFDAGSGWSPMDMESFRIELKPGWNQISNPFPFPVAWEDVENKTDAISDLVYYETVSGIGYERNWQMMSPWEGYFVENRDSTSTRTLYVPPVATDATMNVPLAKQYETGDSEALLLISVEASCGRYFDHDNVLGVKEDASHDLDYYDMSEAPPIGKYVGVWVDNRDWKRGAGHYTADIRKSGSDGYTWKLHAESNLSGKGRTMDLNIRQHTKIPEEWEIFLFDLESDVAVNLKEKTNYAIELLSDGVTSREFKLVAGTEDYVIDNSDGIPLVPATFALSQNYPNPFNPATTIEFTISRRTPVQIHIFNVLGQRVRVLMDEVMRGGRHRIVWDGLSDDGNMMTTGLYFIRLRAEGKHSVKKMMLVR